MKKIMFVFGTRPEAIKMAPVIKEFQKYNNKLKVYICVTAQHREMLDQVLKLYNIQPDFDLNIMKIGQDLTDVTCRVLEGMRNVLLQCLPDYVLVHGDTTTSMAAALASFYQGIPVGHIEAGLRTNNIYSPWPEELNRQITGRIASMNFAPTNLSYNNLIREGIKKEKILITGNTIIDSLHWVIEKINKSTSLQKELEKILRDSGYDINRLEEGRRVIVITGHRRENFGDGFISICNSIKTLATEFPSIDFVYPMHLNPNVRKPIRSIFGTKKDLDNTFFIEPLEYLPFVYLMGKSYLVLTDSGGIQEEAPGLGKPVIVMRDTTERPEAVEAGTVIIAGTNYKRIVEVVSLLINNSEIYNKMSRAINPYGDGHASERIYNYFENNFL